MPARKLEKEDTKMQKRGGKNRRKGEKHEMSMAEKKRIVYAAAVLMILILSMVLAKSDIGRLPVISRARVSGLSEYVEEQTGFNLSGMKKTEEGEVMSSFNREFGIVCVTLKKGSIDSISGQARKMGKLPDRINGIPSCGGHGLPKKLREEDIMVHYTFYRNGNADGDPEYADVYLSTDENGEEHLYCFG